MTAPLDPCSIAVPVAEEDRKACESFVAMPVDPVIRAVLPPTMAQAIAKRREEYRAALQAHDWSFEFSDDGDVYRRGVMQRAKLETMAKSLDPDLAIWNEVAPAEFRRYPQVTDGKKAGDLDFGAWKLPGVVA